MLTRIDPPCIPCVSQVVFQNLGPLACYLGYLGAVFLSFMAWPQQGEQREGIG